MDAHVICEKNIRFFSRQHFLFFFERPTPPALENTVKPMLWSNPHKIGNKNPTLPAWVSVFFLCHRFFYAFGGWWFVVHVGFLLDVWR